MGYCTETDITRTIAQSLTTATAQTSDDLGTYSRLLNVGNTLDKNLVNTANCLVDYISEFYNYTVRNETPRTEEDIREGGGDCYDYSHLFKNLAIGLGFDAYVFTIKKTHPKISSTRLGIPFSSDNTETVTIYHR